MTFFESSQEFDYPFVSKCSFKTLVKRGNIAILLTTLSHCTLLNSVSVESLWAGAIIGDGSRKSWDPRAPMIWDNFAVFSEQIISARIHAHVVGSHADVFVFRDQMMGVERFTCQNFTAMGGNETGNKN